MNAPANAPVNEPGIARRLTDRATAAGRWARVGVLFTVAPAPDPVDLEALVVDTAAVARADERLFVVAASWLAVHHALVDGAVLTRCIRAQAATGAEVTSAVTGALLSLALTAAPGAAAIEAALAECRPLAATGDPRVLPPLFSILEEYPGLLAVVRREALPLYAEWGFAHNDQTLKPNAIRPLAWVLRHAPELRARAAPPPPLGAALR